MKLSILSASLFLMCLSCENSKVSQKKVEDRSNQFKISRFGGCDFKTDCWDYTGSSFQNDYDNSQLKLRCQSEGGQFVSNGCTTQNQIAICMINEKTQTETILHFYNQSGLTLQDAEQLCTAQNGVLADL